MGERIDLQIEEYFLNNFNIENLFSYFEKKDFLFLHYIYLGIKESECENGVYLSEIAEKMHISIAAVSKAIKKLQDKGYVSWEMTPDKERTYVNLTKNAIELIHEERTRMQEKYKIISSQISAEELEVTIRTIKKVNRIIASAENEPEV